MRRLFVVMALGACAPHSASGPAWPKPQVASTDGGESLSPHEARQVISGIPRSDDDVKSSTTASVPVATAPSSDIVAPVVAPSVSQPIEDTITTEDIIIEIDD